MRASLAFLALPIVLAIACGDDSSPGNEPAGGSSGAGSSQSGATSGGATAGGTASNTAGKSAGGAGAAAGAPAAGSGTTAGQGGSAAGTAGGASGGTLGTAGSGGGAAGGSGGGGGDGGCTRALLKSTTEAYFTALAAHDPTTLPLAANVKFTENGKVSKLGDEGLWKTAGALKYSHSALDTETCSSASQAVVPDGTADRTVAVRLKLSDQKLTEIETIVPRAGDYTAVTSNPTQLAASKDVVKWEETVPMDQRATRAELTAWMEKYFKQFPMGVCNVTSDCKRMENGGGSFTCGGMGATCASGSGSGTPVMTPRLVLADVETGIGVGFTIFQSEYTDMHMFKMHGGKVYSVSAILANSTTSGWD